MFRPAHLALATLAIGCGQQAVSAPVAVPPRSVDDSVVCERLVDRFVGLPSLTDEPAGSSRPAPVVGRWWLRTCSTTREKDAVRIRLQGPGWYFVDEDDGDLALRQQVTFDLAVELSGRLGMSSSEGTVSVWLVPEGEPEVQLQVSGDLHVRASSTWGALLDWMPLVPVRAMAAKRFATVASEALRRKLRQGATVTYDLGAGQADATLGLLQPGKKPQNAFADGVPWLVNDRLHLEGSAVQVVGPIAPGPTRLDVLVERGAGVSYRALCVQDMDADYSDLARGEATSTAASPLANGTVSGAGIHTSDFRVDGCKFYLVISPLQRGGDTLVSLRVRA